MPLPSAAPFPAPPDIEPIEADDAARFAPVTFKSRGLGSTLVLLGVWQIGEIRLHQNARHSFEYRVTLPDLPAVWRRPLPYSQACDRVVELVRQWAEASDLARYFLERMRAAAAAERVIRVRK